MTPGFRRPRNRMRQRQTRPLQWRPWLRVGLQFSAGILLPVLLLGLMVLVSRMDPGALMPIDTVEVAGDLRQVDRHWVAETAAAQASGFFVSDISAIRQALESQPWVERALVRRIWPDRLHVTIRDRQPVARWIASFLMDRRGEVFGPVESGPWAHLPGLEGEVGRQVELMQRYLQVTPILAEVGAEVTGLRETARRAWDIVLADGTRILMGRDTDPSRLEQLQVLLPVLRGYAQAPLAEIDLRYSRGAAVTWQLADSGMPQTGGRR